MSQVYGAESVEHLSFREGCRKRVGVYLGSADNEGVLNGLLEIVNNSTDEANAGFGKEIYIAISNNGKVAEVQDFGRGLPRGSNKSDKEVMITLLTQNHSGAKFTKDSYSGFSRGLNGSGGGAVCVTADWMNVESRRDGYVWSLCFENGIPQSEIAIKGNKTKETGTTIEWKPSQEVFSTEEIYLDYKQICSIIEEYSYFNVGIKFIVENKDTKEKKIYLSKNGLSDFAKEKIKNPIHQKPIYKNISTDGIEIETILQWTKDHERYYLFVNGAECPEGGQPITGAKTSITRTLNNLLKKNFSGEIARKGLIYIISIKHPNPIFANQIKTKISNAELRGLTDKLISDAIKTFSEENRDEFNKIADSLSKEERAEAAADRARQSVLLSTKELNQIAKKKVIHTDKLKDALTLGENSILLICEGSSSISSLSQARDPNLYGLMELKGKLINCLTNPIDKVMENEEIKLIFSALGLTPNNYSSKKLRYGKVGIASDSDFDGGHIALLIICFFQRYLPEFLSEGRLFRLISPTHVITKGKQPYYFYSHDEFEKRKVFGSTTLVKGLAELSPAQAKESMFGDNQKLIPLTWNKESDILLSELMGDEVEPRRNFLFSKVDFSKIIE